MTPLRAATSSAIGKTGTVDAKGRPRRSRNSCRQPGGPRVAHQPPRRLQPRHAEPPVAWRPSPATTTSIGMRDWAHVGQPL
jgi:hypothetical protein